jgi:DNA-binding transcriptional LysR family regulator
VIPLTLTYAGQRFIAAARDFTVLETRLSHEIEDIAGNKSGRIIVAASSIRGEYIIPRLFAALKKEYPQMELVFKDKSNDRLLELVRKGGADFAFIGHTHHDLESIHLGDDRLLFAVHAENPLAQEYAAQGRNTIDLRQFCKEPFILLHPGQAIRNITDRIFNDYEMNPMVAYETRSIDMAYHMANAGLGCTFVTSMASAVRYTSGNTIFFDLDCNIYPYPFLLVFKKNAYLSRPMQRLIDLSKELV